MIEIEQVENGYIISNTIQEKKFVFDSLADAFLSIAEYFDENDIILAMVHRIKKEQELNQEHDETV